jgi:GT2 family glycosyltransferase
MPEVSVVILNYKQPDLTVAAVESALDQAGVSPEVIVVENGSGDESAKILRDRFGEKIRLIENEKNLGFSPANNQAFKAAAGTWVALMNNDAVADPFWLKRSLEKTKSQEKIGAVVPKILNYFDREKLDGIGVGLWLDGISRAKHRGETDSGRFDSEQPLIASGCACLLNKKMLDELGGFDPQYFAYSEDTDLGVRALLAGWRVAFAPEAVVYHRYSGTSAGKSKYSPLKLFYVERNRTRVLLRYFPWRWVLASPLTSMVRYLYQASQVLFSSGGGPGLSAWSAMIALTRAVIASVFGLPAQMIWRRKWLSGKSRAKIFNAMFKTNRISLKEISRLD